MENKLKRELEALPGPATSFEELGNVLNTPRTCRRRKRVVILAATVLALLLCGMGWAKVSMRYGLWYLIDSREFHDLERATGKF